MNETKCNEKFTEEDYKKITEDCNKELIDAYKEWAKSLPDKFRETHSNCYSNLFCTGVTPKWCKSDVRILIVGEEPKWGSRIAQKDEYQFDMIDEEIKGIQAYCIEVEESIELKEDNEPETIVDFKWSRSPFWRRYKKIFDLGSNLNIKLSCAWTNIDKICMNKKALTNKVRKELHDKEVVKILHKEIEIMKPTHIIFFGWHVSSLEHEFSELNKQWNGCKYQEIENIENYEGKTFVLTYHPSWGVKKKGFINKNKKYEDEVIESIKT